QDSARADDHHRTVEWIAVRADDHLNALDHLLHEIPVESGAGLGDRVGKRMRCAFDLGLRRKMQAHAADLGLVTDRARHDFERDRESDARCGGGSLRWRSCHDGLRQSQPVLRERHLERSALQCFRAAIRGREHGSLSPLARAVKCERTERADHRRQPCRNGNPTSFWNFTDAWSVTQPMRMKPITGLSVPSAMLLVTAVSRTRLPDGGVPPPASMSVLLPAATPAQSPASRAALVRLPPA